ncbi:hypothetical protein P7G51_06265 [Enterococcus asini]|uniref:hypothetical protein n=1 Tax=Enterococcus asini TaxID=57732 RepID=UPI0028910531|nr:hypothetical protein [Enterococcus asini]MDT2756981.1 hypothetical protein [Enterococcus asini]
MKTIYKILDDKNESGQWFEAYEVADDFPATYGFTTIAPPESMRYPKWEPGLNQWVEDKDSIIDYLTAENAELTSRVDMTEGALLDLADMILTR